MFDDNTTIENIFILPNHTKNVIEYFGYAAIKGKPSWGKIHAYVLDVYKAMDCYVRNRRENIKEKLIKIRMGNETI